MADATIDIINEQDGTDGNADWSGLWITFSAIDKIGHMWGGGEVDTLATYNWTPGTLFEQVHMPWAAKTADDQLGRVIDALKAKGEFDSTLIVVTADHGSTYGGKSDYGDNVYDGGNVGGWYAGTWFPGYTTPTVPNTCRRSGGAQAAHGHRQGRVQLPVHRHRDVAQDGQPHAGPTGSPWHGS